MKKLLVFVIALVCCLSLVACGSSEEADKVAEYVADNKQEIIDESAASFEEMGLSCETDVKADGTKIVIDIKMNDLVDVTDDVKAQMQASLDAMQSQYDAILDEMQKELPEVSGIVYNLLEKDGDLMASIEA